MATTTATDNESTKPTYVESFIPPATLERLEAGAFGQLVNHLKDRSEQVQNIDLMTISGFCRNCLAKWIVVEARRLSQELKQQADSSTSSNQQEELCQALDALGYDQAAEHVYGMGYGEWKKRYAKKATDEIMEKYNHSKSIHATHDKELLATKAQAPTVPLNNNSPTTKTTPLLLANVCCQDPEEVAISKEKPPPKTSRQVTPQVPPPPAASLSMKVAILTVSDRAAAGQYETGDLSGPAVAQALESVMTQLQLQSSSNINKLEYQVVATDIVADDTSQIQSKVKEYATTTAGAVIDLILTTGGTGFAPRDVTPEATRTILDRECHGLMAFVTNECSRLQPMASLSRGTAGILGRSLVVNLPGNPQGAAEILPVLMPLACHAIVDLQKESKN
ncbi:Molybdopterin biosynthesis protein CNX1 [Seminavis robusta]|uniref:molybdopterin molybdotransferase n=1 Tax=Seminavis robusta TaxID=568900 RepID=A0A9N8HLQ6_9STRA|nr:Molybdopterin biosynthesis protein CNX1 [Seminavis robusta]|eukprot:Sro936_g222090.1 Molybdopterin biosynthesis protein CNX1 (393) ;mRNA; r:26139-27317